MTSAPVNPADSALRREPETLSGAEIIVRVLAEQGVDVIFGYSGGAILPTYDAVFRYNADHADAMPLPNGRRNPLPGQAKKTGSGNGGNRNRNRNRRPRQGGQGRGGSGRS